MAVRMVSVGFVVAKRVSATICSGPLPTMQTNLVPPDSIPPYNFMFRLFDIKMSFKLCGLKLARKKQES
jgi:hypothetical protein